MKKLILNTAISALLLSCINASSYAEPSKRIEVYTISQSFWDVTPGDTLSGIVMQLLPDNPTMQKSLFNDIVQLNPDAFSNNSPDKLKANTRLWLPNNTAVMHNTPDKNRYTSQSFSWGQVHRVKRD